MFGSWWWWWGGADVGVPAVVYPAVTIPVHARSLTVLVPDRGTTIPVAARAMTVLVPEREP